MKWTGKGQICLRTLSNIACFENYPWKEQSPKSTPISALLRTKYSQRSAEDTRVSSEGSVEALLCFLTAKIVTISSCVCGVCIYVCLLM